MSNKVESLKKAVELIDMLCEEMEREAPLHNVQVYLKVALASAEGNSLEVKELQNQTGLASSTLSRALGALGEYSYKNREGLKLIEVKADYTDRRLKPFVVSKKGDRLAASINNVMQ